MGQYGMERPCRRRRRLPRGLAPDADTANLMRSGEVFGSWNSSSPVHGFSATQPVTHMEDIWRWVTEFKCHAPHPAASNTARDSFGERKCAVFI